MTIMRVSTTSEGDKTRVHLNGYDKSMVVNCPEQAFWYMHECYTSGMLIQEAFKQLTADEREFLITGMTKEEWDELFEDEEESEEDDDR